MADVICPYCSVPARLAPGKLVYPHSPAVADKQFWACFPCDAWVGCHPPMNAAGRGGLGDGTVPLGRLADAELREWKRRAHKVFDPLWKSRYMRRHEAYAELARRLNLPREQAHIGHFDIDQCRAVIAAFGETS